MRALFLSAALCGLVSAAAIPTGPEVGQPAPDFQLTDQNHAQQTLHSILGPKGALLVFFRSADW